MHRELLVETQVALLTMSETETELAVEEKDRESGAPA
jgi:hypothetical protein